MSSEIDQEWESTLEQFEYLKSIRPCTLRRRIYAGIPDHLRAKVWQMLFHADDVAAKHKANYFEELCEAGESSQSAQIELDVIRTFADSEQFGEEGSGRAQLRLVLNAFAHHTPAIGYSQGLSYVAATLLMRMAPREAFWSLVGALETHNMYTMFDCKLSGLVETGAVFERVLAEREPELFEALDSRSIPPLMYITPWFMTVFSHLSLPWPCVFRIWDAFALEGLPAVYRVSLAILRTVQPMLMAARPGPFGLEDALPVLLSLPAIVSDEPSVLMAQAHKIDSSLVNQIDQAERLVRAGVPLPARRASAATPNTRKRARDQKVGPASAPATPRLGRSLFEKMVRSLPSLTTPRKNMPRPVVSSAQKRTRSEFLSMRTTQLEPAAATPSGGAAQSPAARRPLAAATAAAAAASSPRRHRSSKLRMTASKRSFLEFSTPKQSPVPVGGAAPSDNPTTAAGLSPRNGGGIELAEFSAKAVGDRAVAASENNLVANFSNCGSPCASPGTKRSIYNKRRLSMGTFGQSPLIVVNARIGDVCDDDDDEEEVTESPRKRSRKSVGSSAGSSAGSSTHSSPVAAVLARRRSSNNGLQTPVDSLTPIAGRRRSPLARIS